MKLLTAAQWRVLNHLQFTVGGRSRPPTVTALRKKQDVTNDDLLDLYEGGLLTSMEYGSAPAVFRHALRLLRGMRLSLTTAGMRTALDDAGNQIRRALAPHKAPLWLLYLFRDEHVSGLDMQDIVDAQARKLIVATLDDGFPIEVDTTMRGSILRVVYVALTPKARTYLPR